MGWRGRRLGTNGNGDRGRAVLEPQDCLMSARNSCRSNTKALRGKSLSASIYSLRVACLWKQKRRPKSCRSTRRNFLSYMKLLNVPVGLLINFHERKVTDGISRLILPGANR